ncbi:MAG: NTP transferase domain-containing protein [Trueperaceae bacterium]|nr:MAG: NTP transferase domain-containing protein [Trueperaceae bacterium]
MKSRRPKVLHRAAGRSLLAHVIRAVMPLEPDLTVVVVGFGAEQVRSEFQADDLTFVQQAEQLGTGHALRMTEEVVTPTLGTLLVLNGDGPLLSSVTLERLVESQRGRDGMTLLTCEVKEPKGYGRVVRSRSGAVARIVEEKDATEKERGIREINPGIYAFDQTVFSKVHRLTNANAAGEYYITDLVDCYLRSGSEVRAISVADEQQVLGVNDRKHLALAERILGDRVRDRWLSEGVTMVSPEQTFIDETVQLDYDIVLEPGVVLKGETRIGAGACVGAYCHLTDCVVDPGVVVPPHTVKESAVLS